MRNIIATISRSFNYSEFIADLDDARAKAGEPPMTEEEIRDYVKNDLEVFDYNDFCPSPEIHID